LATSATFTWKTDRPATTEIEYGTTAQYGATFHMEGPASTDHVLGLRGLKPGAKYFYRLRSVDQSGNAAVSRPSTFQTAP
jgi:phosphodiesterase/alkaline phosphatase D-like protein